MSLLSSVLSAEDKLPRKEKTTTQRQTDNSIRIWELLFQNLATWHERKIERPKFTTDFSILFTNVHSDRLLSNPSSAGPVTIVLEVLLLIFKQWTIPRRFLRNQQPFHPQHSLSTQSYPHNYIGKQKSSSLKIRRKQRYNQIDYILSSEKIKHTLISARNFSGTETSDHRLVIGKLQVENYDIFKNLNQTHSESYNTFQLIKWEESKNAYQQQLHENLCKMGCSSRKNIRAIFIVAATKTIGFTSNNRNHRIHNPVVERLSNQQKEVRPRISSTVNNEKVKELKAQRNRILRDIANVLNEDKNCELDKCHIDNKMYQVFNLSTESLYKISWSMVKLVEMLQKLTQFTTSLEILLKHISTNRMNRSQNHL